MKNPISKLTDRLDGKWEMILVSLCEIIVGVLLLVKPLKFTVGIIAAAGILCVLLGLKYGISYFRMDIIRASTQRDLFKCLTCVGGGVFLVFGSGWLSATQAVLNIVYGVALLTLSAEKIQWSVNLLRWQKPYWYVTGISAVLTVVMAILMLLNPFPEQIIWIVIGIALIVEAVLDMVALSFAGKKTKVHTVGATASLSDVPKEKRFKKAKKEALTEASVSEERTSQSNVEASTMELESVSKTDEVMPEKMPEVVADEMPVEMPGEIVLEMPASQPDKKES